MRSQPGFERAEEQKSTGPMKKFPVKTVGVPWRKENRACECGLSQQVLIARNQYSYKRKNHERNLKSSASLWKSCLTIGRCFKIEVYNCIPESFHTSQQGFAWAPEDNKQAGSKQDEALFTCPGIRLHHLFCGD